MLVIPNHECTLLQQIPADVLVGSSMPYDCSCARERSSLVLSRVSIRADAIVISSESVDLRTSIKLLFNSAAPPPPMLHGCLPNVSRSASVTLTNSFCDLAVVQTDPRSTARPAPAPGRRASSARPGCPARRGPPRRPAGGCGRTGSPSACRGRGCRPRGVDDVRQVHRREELLDQLLAELALHERVGRDHPDEPGRSAVVTGEGEVEEPLGERHAERILPVAGRPAVR